MSSAEYRDSPPSPLAGSQTLYDPEKFPDFERLDNDDNLGLRSDGFERREERDRLLDGHDEKRPETVERPKTSSRMALAWMAINTLATIGIVFTNKAIFSDPSVKLVQLSFAAFHFTITWLTLWTISRPPLSLFTPRRASLSDILPLSIAMALNVILPNLSLAFSSVTFYQVARILLTPTVAALNYCLYGATLPQAAIFALIPTCLGVALTSYYDSLPAASASVTTTSPLGVFFAFAGIAASSLYTVWIGSYHRKLNMSSMQLLANQAPVAAFLLLYVIPFVDVFPDWAAVSGPRWFMMLLSGMFASIINISQFFIISQTGAVTSTVVGHVKTCAIVSLGWTMSGRVIMDKAIVGVIIALGGIIT